MLLRVVAGLLLGTMTVGTQVSSKHEITLDVEVQSELIAAVEVLCDHCAWDVPGREGVFLTAAVDRRYAAHIPVFRTGRATYDVLLGTVPPGRHTVMVGLDPARTPRMVRANVSWRLDRVNANSTPDPALEFAPFLYARSESMERFTDVPVFMWYEVEPAGIGTRYRYSVIFTNEDGGTPSDRLMATWGRTTDIEYIYSVVVDANGKVLADDYQGPDHVTTPFRGQREGRHPLLWVSTHNNMVRDRGDTQVRYALSPQLFPLVNTSREAVMDANPWLYEVMARELAREGKIVPDAPPGRDAIPDPRRFVYIESCGEVGTSALAFSVRARSTWLASDRGVPEYRIVRDGCARAAVPLPGGVEESDIDTIRAHAYERPPRKDAPPPKPTPVRLTRINAVFMLDATYRPRPSLFQWKGSQTIAPGDHAGFTLP